MEKLGYPGSATLLPSLRKRPMPIRVRILPKVIQQVGRSEFFKTFIHSNAILYSFVFLISVIIFCIFDNIVKLLHLIEMDTDPDLYQNEVACL